METRQKFIPLTYLSPLIGNQNYEFLYNIFHVYVDEEINKEELCRLVPAKERESSFPSEFLDCEDLQLPDGIYIEDLTDLYGTEISEDDIEECD